MQAMGAEKYAGTTRRAGKRNIWTGTVNLDWAALGIPRKWRKPRRIFVNSMSDLFQEGVPPEFIEAVWEAMEKASWHTFQILTKRPARMRRVVKSSKLRTLPNVWLGTSIESPRYLERAAHLRSTPASVRFISFEPLLTSVGQPDLSGIDWAIVGGESGPGARSMNKEWVAEIKRACRKSGTAFFFKQWGGKNKKLTGRVLDGRTWDAYPNCARRAA